MRRALATLAALHAADAAFECVRDAHGCCSSAGYFFCGSSGRCVGRDDPCEDGSGAAAATYVAISAAMVLVAATLVGVVP